MKEAASAAHLMKRPEIGYADVAPFADAPSSIAPDVAEQVEIQVKYEGYISKQLEQVERMKKMEEKKIPESIDYHSISGIAIEARQKLSEVRPLSVGQASRVSGVNPSDISILLVYIEQGRMATT
jgi:tRNA uridine 5-carboxymethylaminomethyl modification enzyme